MKLRGEHSEIQGVGVLLDDNTSSTQAFLWCNGLNLRSNDTQFNNIYRFKLDMATYMALPNIFMTPTFLVKLTNKHPEVQAI